MVEPDKLLEDHLEDLKRTPGWQLIAARRQAMKEQVFRELLTAKTVEDIRFAQGRASVLEVDEIECVRKDLREGRL